MEENKVTTNQVPAVPAVPEPQSEKGKEQRGSFGFRRGPGRNSRQGGRSGRGRFGDQAKPEYDQKVIDVARVTRVTKGGKRFSFRTTVIIGDAKGKVGMGIGKGTDVSQSIQKAFNKAKRNLIIVPMVDNSIPYQVEAKYNSAMVLLKPAKGGVKAGGPVRVIAQLAGIKSLTGKLLSRTNNKINIAIATLKALSSIRTSKIQDHQNKKDSLKNK